MAFQRFKRFWAQARHYTWHHLNFYRIHLLVFCISPLILAAIMFASNGRYPLSYVDALFNSVSAITVTGLTTVNLSGLTGWQQALLFIQMVGGNIVTVSWIMVIVRRYFFQAKVNHIVEGLIARKNNEEGGHPVVRRLPLSWSRKVIRKIPGVASVSSGLKQKGSHGSKDNEKLRTDMIRRVSALPPQLLNPNGQISIKTPTQEHDEKTALSTGVDLSSSQNGGEHLNSILDNSEALRGRSMSTSKSVEFMDFSLPAGDELHPAGREKRSVDFNHGPSGEQSELSPEIEPNLRDPTVAGTSVGFPRTVTVEFQEPEGITRRTGRRPSFRPGVPETGRPSLSPDEERRPQRLGQPLTVTRSLPRTTTMHTNRSAAHTNVTRESGGTALRRVRTGEDVGFGGFPMPHEIIGKIVNYAIPKISDKLHRTISVPARTISLSSQNGDTGAPDGVDLRTRTKSVPYISFDAIIGRNSQFYDLREEELEELGGVEYRALSILLWLVPLYFIGAQLIAFIVIAPYVALPRWKPAFSIQMRPLDTTWYSAFVVTSAFTNSGMSLVDQSMIPFKDAYPQIIFLIWVILAGNTCYPVFFRLTIWLGSKISRNSRTSETLQFLLDHPRRCFVYLFPSHQTWFLVAFVLILTLTDFVSFLLLDIGNAEIQAIPIGIRILDGLLQSAAVRAAGFGIVSLGNLAPAVKVLYVVMMYVSVYPIALSVRSSNVYEERSLGLAEENAPNDDEEEPQTKVWGSYLAWHARRQLSFDMWWMVLALVLICIVERGQINDPEKAGIDIFPILFEVISAYGTVGLSLGAPGQNYSLAGALSPLSKVILCIVMLRGRHRGLPVAIDRAVMLPHEFRDMNQTSSTNPTEEGDTPSTQTRRDVASGKSTAAYASYPFPGHPEKVGPLDTSANDGGAGAASLSPSTNEAHNHGANAEPWKQNQNQTLLSPVAEA